MFIGEWSLFISVTLDAGCIRTSGQSRLFEFEPTMRVVTVAALHHTFEHFVVEWLVKVGLNFTMTTDAELRLSHLQQIDC